MIELDELDQAIAARLRLMDYCYQCGICSSLCPYSPLTEFRPRKFILEAQLEPEKAVNSDLLWQCSACFACVIRCPMEVRPPDLFSALRARALEEGAIPDSFAKTLFDSLTNVHRYGNPWGHPSGERSQWAEGLDIKGATPGMDLLYYVGCSPSYDQRVQGIPRALVRILGAAGIDFGTLGQEERCCGDAVRWLGEEGLFQELAQENLGQFNEYGPRQILTTSPHCYNVFKNDYPRLQGEVLHYSQWLAQLLAEGRIGLSGGPEVRVTYHDPCYLGRHNRIYEEPRSILRSIPGVEVVEMPRSRERSLCCGGGGGRMWLGAEQEEERPSEIRVKEALQTGANLLVTACPFCLINFIEAAKSLNLEDRIGIADLAVFVSEQLG